jgi:hypothetical protein
MDDLDKCLRSLLAIAGSEQRYWDRINRFLKDHRPKRVGKLGRPQGITDFAVKWLAFEAYEKAPRGKKPAAEAEVYKRFGMKVSPEAAKKNRQRVVKHLGFDDDDLSEFIKGDR